MTDGVASIQPVEASDPSAWTHNTSEFAREGFRFGVFELDTKTGELRKEGRLVHLRNQPFQVLALLLDRAGDLVTREEIKAALWADSVDVDVEQGLNYCVKEVRQALGDNALAPRFIQTLPRRGYRFVADVRRGDALDRPKAGDPVTQSGQAPSVAPPRRRLAFIMTSALIVTAVALASFFVVRPAKPGTGAPAGSIRLVVLPFADLSATPEGYLADGLTDELIASLGKKTAGRLSVIARSSALVYRKREQDAASFARELGASHFIEGTIRREGSTVRLHVSLARAGDGTQVWSETYDRNIKELLALEREVVGAIGSGVRVAVNAEAGPPVALDSGAYLEYLRGRYEWNKRTRESLFESRRIFESITRTHPDFAPGWAGLADAYSVLMDHGHVSTKDAWLQARQAAEKAVDLDPELAEAWTNLGMIRGLYEWNAVGSEEAFAKAAALNPNYATRLHWQSILFRSEERYQEAYLNLRRARDLDPLSLGIRVNLAGVLLDLGRNDDALAEAMGIASVAPGWGPGLMVQGDAFARANRLDEAEAAYLKAEAAGAPAARAELASFYVMRGKLDLARGALADLEAQARTSYVSPYLMAVAAAGLDPERAFRALEAAFEERSPALRSLKRDPRFDPIRADPRFTRLVRILWPETPAR
ncbi:MAG: winged helix-turn-helix domain-containing protein [Vicinamibacteria bacterium]|nr:winged helix-turn-helix domain-containing protein [Vicinamibacteria bacterium]